MSANSPNIVMIVTDQLRADALGCYGNAICRTPNVDRLAEGGMRFDKAYTTVPVCSPSRVSMLTGMYPHNHKVLINTHIDTRTSAGLDPEAPSLGRMLAGRGYDLAYYGKWHVHQDFDPTHYGFHQYTPLDKDGGEKLDPIRIDFAGGSQLVAARAATALPEEPSCRLAEAAASFLRERAAQRTERRPFFLRVDFLRPHFPNVVPLPFAGMYDAARIPPWPNFEETFRNKPSGHWRKHMEWALHDKEWDWWSKAVAMYYADVSYVDHCCGIVLDALRESGLDRDTLVVFTADHADSIGSHRHFEKGGTMYEEVMRIPLIVRWPGVVAEGAASDSFVRNMDVMPTLVRAAGGTPPDGIDALDLSPLLRRNAEPEGWPDSVYAEYHGDVWGPYTQRMVRTHDCKYVFNPYDIDELYDLANDPHEMNNLVFDPDWGGVLANMRGRLHGWIRHTRDMFTFPFVTRNFPEPIDPIGAGKKVLPMDL